MRESVSLTPMKLYNIRTECQYLMLTTAFLSLSEHGQA